MAEMLLFDFLIRFYRIELFRASIESFIIDIQTKVCILLHQKRFAEMEAMLPNYPSGESKDIWDQVYSVMSEVKLTQQDYKGMSAQAIVLLHQIANSGKSGCIHAQILLAYLNDETEIEEEVVFPHPGTRFLNSASSTQTTPISSLSIYPNPTSDLAYLMFDENHKPQSIKIYNSTGTLVMNQTCLLSFGLLELNCTSLPSGLYQMQVIGQNQTIEWVSFVKQ